MQIQKNPSGALTTFLEFTKTIQSSIEKQLDPKGIATCDIPGEQGLDPLPYPSGLPMQRIYKQQKIKFYCMCKTFKLPNTWTDPTFLSSNVFAMSAVKN